MAKGLHPKTMSRKIQKSWKILPPALGEPQTGLAAYLSDLRSYFRRTSYFI
ncbi:hypothetical protein HY990_01045 [Candidatus Micrarchaeota archaeon]|nr:hypothetical protein [Candidatus Micrarchaeota archaeon]